MTDDTMTSNDTKTNMPRRRPGGLGRGLNALLGEAVREEPIAQDDRKPAGAGLATIAIAEIKPHPDQPRRHFDEAALLELAESIASRGVIQPVIVRPMPRGGYQLVAGERRWRAAQKARLHAIPAIVRELSESDTLALALIENIQREDLNPVEEARAYRRLMELEGLNHGEIGKMVDKSRSHVANLTRLLDLPEKVLDLVAAAKLGMGHARALINSDDAVALAQQAVEKDMSVRDVEKLVRARRQSGKGRGPVETKSMPMGEDADIAAVEKHLADLLGLTVKIQTDANKRSGAVTVRFGSLDQLDLICQRLSGEHI